LERLQKRFGTGILLDAKQSVINDWNAGKIKLLFAHPQSAGHGLNIQHGGSLIVWFSLNWNLEYYQQFNARLHRQGQTMPVRIVHLVAENTIDERVVNVLKDKDISQSSLLKALR
jgi:SNF2 family DNA or RNA helicase